MSEKFQSFSGIRSQDVAAAMEDVVANSYEARLESLQAAANDGEAALIADPVESQAWYVNFPLEFLTENGFRARNRMKIAEYVLKWTSVGIEGVARDQGEPEPLVLETEEDLSRPRG